MWVKIYHNYYEINKGGVIRRAKPGPATRVGKILKPYYPGGPNAYVRLCAAGRMKQCTVDELVTKTFRKYAK